MTPQQELDAIRAALESPAAQEWGEGDRWGITLSECDWTAEKIIIKEQEAHGNGAERQPLKAPFP